MSLPMFAPPLESDLYVPFWDSFARGEIVLPRCSSCQRFQWYPDETGPDCVGAEYEWIPVETTGVVYSLTRVHRPFVPADAAAVPFLVGFVDLDGADGARLVANFDERDGRVEIGTRVAAVFVEQDGRWRPVFRAVST